MNNVMLVLLLVFIAFFLVLLVVILLDRWLRIIRSSSSSSYSYSINVGDQQQQQHYGLFKSLQLNPTNFIANQRECSNQSVYSMDDEYCAKVCTPSQTPGYIVRSVDGVCRYVPFSYSQTQMNNNICDPDKGVYAFLIGDPQFGTIEKECISIDPGVQPDDIHQPNRLCLNGFLQVNYKKAFPQLKDCICPENHLLYLIPDTSAIRRRGVCLSNSLYSPFQYNNLVYNNKTSI